MLFVELDNFVVGPDRGVLESSAELLNDGFEFVIFGQLDFSSTSRDTWIQGVSVSTHIRFS